MFPTEFPQTAALELLKGKTAGIPQLVLAGYELLGYGLGLYFGDVKFLVNGDFDMLNKVAETAATVEKVLARAKQLKAGGVGNLLLIIQLVQEFGPVVFTLVQSIRALFANKG